MAGSGNTSDRTAGVTEPAAPSVLSVGGIVISPDGDLDRAEAFPGSRGTTFEGKWIPEILAPAENIVLPHGTDEEIENHFYSQDRQSATALCSHTWDIVLGADRSWSRSLCVAGASELDSPRNENGPYRFGAEAFTVVGPARWPSFCRRCFGDGSDGTPTRAGDEPLSNLV